MTQLDQLQEMWTMAGNRGLILLTLQTNWGSYRMQCPDENISRARSMPYIVIAILPARALKNVFSLEISDLTYCKLQASSAGSPRWTVAYSFIHLTII